MLLAAGRGERMRPLTDHTPKPLLQVAGHSLLERHLLALKAAGLREFVVNSAHLGNQIREFLGNGSRWGVRISHSPEPSGALDTGGGILHALPLLGTQPFVVVNGDIYSDFPFRFEALRADDLAHLLLVANPAHNPLGDFALANGRVSNVGTPRSTYAGIAILRAELFATCRPGKFPLAPLLREATESGRVGGQRFEGRWTDVGTPERLQQLRCELAGANTNTS
jgi:MurNAc alpha-1-phosphate uridylyltransferase